MIIPEGSGSAKRHARTHDTCMTLLHVRVQDMSRRKQRNPKSIVTTGEEELKTEPQEESDEDSRELRWDISMDDRAVGLVAGVQYLTAIEGKGAADGVVDPE